jgi:hypothetical protein
VDQYGSLNFRLATVALVFCTRGSRLRLAKTPEHEEPQRTNWKRRSGDHEQVDQWRVISNNNTREGKTKWRPIFQPRAPSPHHWPDCYSDRTCL